MTKLLAIFTAFVSLTVCSYAQPKLTIIGGDEYSWGDVRPAQSPLKASIQLKNEGDKDLYILNVKPSCGCTAAKPEKDTLKPNEVTAMNVEFSVGANTGVTQKNVLIETNDPTRNKVWFKISSNIIRDIICKPSQHLAYKELEIGKEAEQSVYLKNNSQAPIHFSDMKVEPPIIKFTIPNSFTLKPGEEIEVKGKITPKNEGYNNVRITFKTDNPDNPTYEINAYGNAVASKIFNSDAPKTEKR
ncbi:MAG: DUF1573 domain-containing protein [Ignavibacteria bacterium]|jgi:hypothetical protein|nr:DUF1573 domain-containing protein [Ignavibacteria bacterium]